MGESIAARLVRTENKKDRPARIVFMWVMVVGIAFSGVAFAFKIATFISTITAKEAQGFADVPVAVYFFIAGGWLLLLVWCFKADKFKEMDQAKTEIFEWEEEYDRKGL